MQSRRAGSSGHRIGHAQVARELFLELGDVATAGGNPASGHGTGHVLQFTPAEQRFAHRDEVVRTHAPNTTLSLTFPSYGPSFSSTIFVSAWISRPCPPASNNTMSPVSS